MGEKLKQVPFFWACACVVLGAAFLSSIRVGALNITPDTLSTPVIIARFFELATYAVVLVAFRRNPPSPKNLFLVALPFMGFYVAIFIGLHFTLDAATAQALSFAGEGFFGISDALLVLFYCAFFALYDPQISVVLFVAQKLLANIFTFCISVVPSGAEQFLRPILFAACAIAFWQVGKRVLNGGAEFAFGTDGERPAAESGAAVSGPAGSGTSRKATKLVASTSVTMLDWLFLIAVTAFFRYVFGAASQLKSAIWGDLALFNAALCIFAAAADILLLLYFVSSRKRFDFGTIFTLVAPLYVAAFGLYLAFGTESMAFADVILRIGADFAFILAPALAARMAYENPSGTFFYFGCTALVTNSYPGRLIGWALCGNTDLHATFANLALVVLCSLCIIAIVLFIIQRNADTLPFLTADDDAPAGESENAADEAAAASEDVPTEAQAAQAALRADYETLFLRAEALSARLQFSQREQEILMYVLQGYTRDGIAERLYLSPDTVKSYMSRIYLKVGINSKKALLAKVNEEPL